MRDPKVAKGEPSPSPLCTLSFNLPENILPDVGSEQDLLDAEKSLDFLTDFSMGKSSKKISLTCIAHKKFFFSF